MWNLGQRRVLLALILLALLWLTAMAAIRGTRLDNPVPAVGPRADQLADHLDPNTATRGELAEIPGVGETLAAAIIDYRQSFERAHPGQVAFTSPTDLHHVRGIGVARQETLQEYLFFPTSRPTH